MNLHFDCVFYHVRDLDTAIHFYKNTLGFSLISRDTIARFNLDGVFLELVPATGDCRPSGRGNARLCLRVDDIEQTLAQLRERGVSVGEIQVQENGKLAFFEDPDGNELGLWQYRS